MQHRLHGFGPVVDATTRVLILGSMPSSESLRRGEYYGHSRNRFWPLMEALFGIPADSSYEMRLSLLMKSEVGLWDVLESCERVGSLDATIVSEKCQNFEQLLNLYPGIASILCNGSKAYISFLRLVVPALGVDRLVGRRIEKLPSTSPANASYSMDKLMQAWSTAFGYGFAEGVDVLLRLRAND